MAPLGERAGLVDCIGGVSNVATCRLVASTVSVVSLAFGFFAAIEWLGNGVFMPRHLVDMPADSRSKLINVSVLADCERTCCTCKYSSTPILGACIRRDGIVQTRCSS